MKAFPASLQKKLNIWLKNPAKGYPAQGLPDFIICFVNKELMHFLLLLSYMNRDSHLGAHC
jgi:hypothetical protein